MKDSLEARGWVLVVLLLFVTVFTGFLRPDPETSEWSALFHGQKIPPPTLHVPPKGQMGSNWCGAACIEMVTEYYHNIIGQCSIMQKQPGGSGLPCPRRSPAADQYDNLSCDPLTTLWLSGYNGYYANNDTIHTNGPDTTYAVSYDTLAREFSAGRPVIFNWGWVGVTIDTGSSPSAAWHDLVAEGMPLSHYCSHSAWVSVNDPDPIGVGHHSIMGYSEFSNTNYVSLQPYPSRDYSRNGLFVIHGADILGIEPSAGGSK